jgi:hypothetical protein
MCRGSGRRGRSQEAGVRNQKSGGQEVRSQEVRICWILGMVAGEGGCPSCSGASWTGTSTRTRARTRILRHGVNGYGEMGEKAES